MAKAGRPKIGKPFLTLLPLSVHSYLEETSNTGESKTDRARGILIRGIRKEKGCTMETEKKTARRAAEFIGADANSQTQDENIRAIQIGEGNDDCYKRKAGFTCGEIDCDWYDNCQEMPMTPFQTSEETEKPKAKASEYEKEYKNQVKREKRERVVAVVKKIVTKKPAKIKKEK